MTGRVLQLSLKSQTAGEPGLPKRAVPSLRLTPTGAEGDFNQWRAANLPGDLDQAVLLMTYEVLSQLQREGWAVEPGHLGENVTLTGIPEAALAPGVRLALGDVVLEVSQPCDPCTRLYSLPYVGAERGAAFLKATTGRRGWYARVITPGTVEPGAPVTLLADHP